MNFSLSSLLRAPRTSVLFVAVLFAQLFGVSCFADQILNWNRVAADVLLNDTAYQNPGYGSRTMAMVNLAMYDSVNSIAPVNQPFYTHPAAPLGADAQAAAAQAARDVLLAIYPGQQSMLNSELATVLSGIPNGAAKTAGINFGATVASNVITARANDGYNNMVAYSPSGTIGSWEPDPINPTQVAWGPEWGQVAMFGAPSSTPFIPIAPPALTSQEYADAYNEVKALGEVNSTVRTPDQTEAAIFWAYDRVGMGTPMRMYNKILRDVATQEGNTMHENAKLFALATVSVADAGITAWDAKFEYDFWRPISGIRKGDQDGNPMTIADPNWTPLGAPGNGTTIPDFTPPFPTYISGHATFGAALFESMASFYGTDAIGFSVTSEELPGVTRSFNSFSEAMTENGRSRVYMGIHWEFDDRMSHGVGAAVADYTRKNHFEPVPEPGGLSLLTMGVLALCFLRRSR